MTSPTPEMQKQASDLFDKVKAELNTLLGTILTNADAGGELSELKVNGTLTTVVTALHSLAADLIFCASTSQREYLSNMRLHSVEMNKLMAAATASTLLSMLDGKPVVSPNKFFSERTKCGCESCKRRRAGEPEDSDAPLHALIKALFGDDITIIPVSMNDEEPQKH